MGEKKEERRVRTAVQYLTVEQPEHCNKSLPSGISSSAKKQAEHLIDNDLLSSTEIRGVVERIFVPAKFKTLADLRRLGSERCNLPGAISLVVNKPLPLPSTVRTSIVLGKSICE